jgi:hypothetical protein
MASHGNVNAKEESKCGHVHSPKQCVYILHVCAYIYTHVDTSPLSNFLPVYCPSRIISFEIVGPHMSFHSTRRIKLLQNFAFLAAGIEECTFDSDGKYDVIMWS